MRPELIFQQACPVQTRMQKSYADSALQSADKSAKDYADAAQTAAVKAATGQPSLLDTEMREILQRIICFPVQDS